MKINPTLEKIGYPLTNFPRICLTAFLFNFSAYFYWIVIPLLANDIGATTIELSLLQALSYGLGALFSPVAGKLGDLFNPYFIFRVSAVALIIGFIITIIWGTKLWILYISVCFYSIGSGLFWPVVTSTVGKEAKIGSENKNSSIFAVCWSFGKSVGYLFGGLLKKSLGVNALYVAIGCLVFTMIIYPYRLPKSVRERNAKKKEQEEQHKQEHGTHEHEDVEIPLDMVNDVENQMHVHVSTDTVDEEHNTIHVEEQKIKYKWSKFQLKNKTYIYLAYILNFSIVGCASILSNQYLKLVKQKDIGIDLPLAAPNDMFLGMFFFIFYLAQTIMFVIMAFTTVWTYHRSLILVAQSDIMLLCFMLIVLENAYVILVFAFLGGLAAGFSYQMSTYYSLRASEVKKGLFVGISEGMAKLGMAFLPLIAGVCASATDSGDSYFIPIYIAIGVELICTIICDLVFHIMHRVNKYRQSKRKEHDNTDEHNGNLIELSRHSIDDVNSVNDGEFYIPEPESPAPTTITLHKSQHEQQKEEEQINEENKEINNEENEEHKEEE